MNPTSSYSSNLHWSERVAQDDTPRQSHNGGSGVFVSSREIYDKLLTLEINMSKLPTKEDFNSLEDRVRRVEIAGKAITPALILVLVTIILAFVQMQS